MRLKRPQLRLRLVPVGARLRLCHVFISVPSRHTPTFESPFEPGKLAQLESWRALATTVTEQAPPGKLESLSPVSDPPLAGKGGAVSVVRRQASDVKQPRTDSPLHMLMDTVTCP